jgi:hypothetical protein
MNNAGSLRNNASAVPNNAGMLGNNSWWFPGNWNLSDPSSLSNADTLNNSAGAYLYNDHIPAAS